MNWVPSGRESIGYGNNCSPVSASSTRIALIGQLSAASRICSTGSPSGSTASDWRLSLSRKTCGANVSHMALPTQRRWSTRTRTFLAINRPLLPVDRKRLQRPEGDARLVFQLLVIEPEAGEALRQGLEHLLALDPRQRRPQAVVDTRAEGDMLVRPPRDVEMIGLLEH